MSVLVGGTGSIEAPNGAGQYTLSLLFFFFSFFFFFFLFSLSSFLFFFFFFGLLQMACKRVADQKKQ
jgi:hypothetical protein